MVTLGIKTFKRYDEGTWEDIDFEEIEVGQIVRAFENGEPVALYADDTRGNEKEVAIVVGKDKKGNPMVATSMEELDKSFGFPFPVK